MKTRLLIPSLILLGSIATGCQKEGTDTAVTDSRPVTDASSFPAPLTEDAPAATQPPEGTTRINTKVAGGKGVPLRILAGQTVSGSSSPEVTATLAALGVRIGNYHNSSNGSLQLSLCVNGACQDATAPLANSRDNDHLIFTLSTPIALTPESILEYRFTRSTDSTNRLAIWGYPAPAGQGGMTDANGGSTNLIPRLSLYVRR